MEQIRDDLTTQLGQIMDIYRNGIQRWPEHLASITAELLKIRTAIDRLVQGGGSSITTSIWRTGLQDHSNLLHDLTGTNEFNITGQDFEAPNSNMNSGSASADVESAIGSGGCINPCFLMLDSTMPVPSISSNRSLTLDQTLDHMDESDIVCSSCAQPWSNFNSSRKRKSANADTDNQVIHQKRIPLRERLGEPLGPLHSAHSSAVRQIYNEVGELHALLQLRILLRDTRSHNDREYDWQASQLPGIVCALDRMEELIYTSEFLHRILLLRLLQEREMRLQDIVSQEPELCGSRVESLVLDNLICAAYPIEIKEPRSDERAQWREEYRGKRVKFKNRLARAKGWQSAVDILGFGIIALFPTGMDGKVRNYRFETLPSKERIFVLQQLQLKHDGYIETAASNLEPFVKAVYNGERYDKEFAIENLDETEIMNMDVSAVLDLCRELPTSSANLVTPS